MHKLPTFRDAYRRCCSIVPSTASLSGKQSEGGPSSAIATKDGSPFGIGRLWEKRKDLTSAEWIRTFAVITTDKLVTEIRDRVPPIITRGDYERWLMRPYPVEPMRMWPISTWVNQAEERRPLDSRGDRAICCVTACPQWS